MWHPPSGSRGAWHGDPAFAPGVHEAMHIDEDVLEALALNLVLDRQERLRIEHHLEDCDECAERYVTIETIRLALLFAWIAQID